MSTFQEIADEVDNTLHSYLDGIEPISSNMDDIPDGGALEFQVDDPTQIGQGVVEVDDELMYVQRVDASTATVVVPAYGRGWSGSPVSAHPAGSMLVYGPAFPKFRVKSTVNDVLSSLYPTLYQVKTDDSQEASAVKVTYPAPADCDTVLDLQWETIGPTGQWARINRYRLDTSPDPVKFPTGRSLDIYEGMVPGRTILLTYVAPLTAFGGDDEEITGTGLPDGAKDLLVFGAISRLAVGLEFARLQLNTTESSARASEVQPGQASNVSKYYFQLFQTRVADEQSRLQNLYPTRIHEGI